MEQQRIESAVGTGIFTVPEASRLTGLPSRRIHRWFGADGRKPTFLPSFMSGSGKKALSFLDLIDVLIAGKLRERGVSLQALRRSYINLQETFGTPHAFCYRDVWTDGRTVFLRDMLASGERKLVDMEHRQLVLTKVIEPYLEEIEYDPEGDLAQRWHIEEGLIVDPDLNFGAPTLIEIGLPIYVVAATYDANGRDLSKTASWYDIDTADVRRAVAFQHSLAA